LHGHGAKGGVLARIVGSALRVNKYRVARLYSPHGGSLHFERRSLAGSLILRVERLQERLTDALVFVCEYERRTYGARVGLPLARNELIYNGIDDAEFEPVETGPGAVDFLFIEGFAAAEEIAGRRLSALMVGDGPQQRQYEEMTLRMGLADRVRLLPAMRAREAFALARKVVIPSRAESMPYILLEALAAGKPVIATRVGGIPEVLGADSEALVPPGDAGALARLMADAIRDAGWAARTMPDAERFKSRFAASVMTRHVMQLYRDLTEESLVPQGRLRTT
jgi:hypothetical protein